MAPLRHTDKNLCFQPLSLASRPQGQPGTRQALEADGTALPQRSRAPEIVQQHVPGEGLLARVQTLPLLPWELCGPLLEGHWVLQYRQLPTRSRTSDVAICEAAGQWEMKMLKLICSGWKKRRGMVSKEENPQEACSLGSREGTCYRLFGSPQIHMWIPEPRDGCIGRWGPDPIGLVSL